jgi:hypothetical protein
VNFAARWIVGRADGSAKERRRSRKIAPPSDAASILTLDIAATPLEAVEPQGSSAHPENQEPSLPESRD